MNSSKLGHDNFHVPRQTVLLVFYVMNRSEKMLVFCARSSKIKSGECCSFFFSAAVKNAMDAKLCLCLVLIILGTLTAQGAIPRNKKKDPSEVFARQIGE